ncbi:DUF4443 domain-containing protein [Candidatus Altiarchaeota archaeon]
MAGADPSFTEVHLVRTLFLLGRKRQGRKKLVKLLGVGEGSVRTIIKRLSGDGLISSSMRGHELTGAGQERLKGLLNRFSGPVGVETDVVDGSKALLVVYGAAGRLGSGVNERDTAVKAGATGALVMYYSGGELVFPSTGGELDAFKDSLQVPEADEGDVIVLSFACDLQRACDGAVAIALRLTS